MELLLVLLTIVAVVGLMLLVSVPLLGDRHRSLPPDDLSARGRTAIPFLGMLGAVLAFNAQFRMVFQEVSVFVGWRITPLIYRFEGNAVIWIQSLFGEHFTVFFSFMYIYGYVFLLVFPLVGYFLLEKLHTFKAIVIAYALNYSIGFLCYFIFVAYGPRNVIDGVGAPMYDMYPIVQILTSEINEHTNVFPSLHTSLAATVMLFAWYTREDFPLWTAIAMFFGISVIISTMYLGIHWVIDVLAGLLLAWVSYRGGLRYADRRWGTGFRRRAGGSPADGSS